MKWFTLILSTLILSLSAIPCADGQDGHSHELSIIDLVDHDHDTSGNEEDECSPFCVCDCCSTTVVLQLKFLLVGSQLTEMFKPAQNFYSELYSILYQFKILHPPRLS